MSKISGLHHITAIAGDAQRNYDFYTKILGFRLVKKTVNFDDPKTYHFYFGNEVGTPGTILTFFPWANVRQGKNGAGMATEIGYSVPKESLEFWKTHFEKNNVRHDTGGKRFGEEYIAFQDPDGLWLNLIETKQKDERKGWETAEINADVAIKGFHTVTLTLNNIKATAAILTEVFGYRQVEQEGNFYRYQTDAVENAAIVDLLEKPQAQSGLNAGGTIHHVAFRVKDEETLMAMREKIAARGLHITGKINRDYFFSLYFREPGGVLFEIATDNPGFATDEPVEKLGSSLQLPNRYKPMRAEIEKALIMIHGRGANAPDILGLASHLNVSEFALLAPEATNHTWYPFSFMAAPEQNEPWLSSALSLLKEVVDEVTKKGIRAENIYFLGFSQGACLVLEFVARHATKMGGVVAFTGGLIGDKINPENYSGNFDSTPFFISTGNPDPHVPLERVNESVDILKKMNAMVHLQVYEGRPHTITQDEIEYANQVIFKLGKRKE